MFWILWLVLAIGLAIAELHSGDFTLLMFSGGCLAGLAAALVFPDLIWAQAIVAAIAAGILLWALRPTLLHRVRSMPGYRSSLDRMVGSSGIVTQAITAESGEVKIDGEVWSARSLYGHEIPVDATIDVYEVDGTFLMVALQPELPTAPGHVETHVAEPPKPSPAPAPKPGLITPPTQPGDPSTFWARPAS